MTLQSRRLREIASHDPLTGILNRAAIMAALDRQIEMSGVTGKNFGVIMVDIDHFKQVNDTHGHAAGDEVLRELVRRVSTALRRTDDFGRYGGEEFLVLIGDTSRGELLGTAEHLRWLVACAPVDLGGTPLQITASFGVAFAPDAGISAAELLKSADDALYAAKAGGRNRCEAADSAPSLTE
jgi:diguanylate cyclase (GGDEF)-like protein